MPGTHDTIVAVSSPPGRSWRAMVRLSGDDVLAVLGGALDRPLPPRRLVPARLSLGHVTLPLLALYLPTPGTYTGQDTLELQVPGHPALLDRLLHQCVAGGARLAEAGEFTFRAFMTGRIDLTQAEGIAATIAAQSDTHLHAAGMLRHGRLREIARSLVDRVASLLSRVEAGIDFVDQEDVVPITPGTLDEQLGLLQGELEQVLAHSRSWDTVESVPRVVLAGRPSAGKSTLFNALLGHARAITSAMPGTTRDVLVEPLTLTPPGGSESAGVEILLVDMAGLESNAGEGTLDQQAQAAAHAALSQADVILHLVPADHEGPMPTLDHLPSEAASNRADVLTVRTMADRRPAPCHAVSCDDPTPGDATCQDEPLWVSAVTGHGLDTLRQRLVERLGQRGGAVGAQTLVLHPRHDHHLREASQAIHQTRVLLQPQRNAASLSHIELIASELRRSLDELASLGGEMTPDQIIGRIFATFCVGK